VAGFFKLYNWLGLVFFGFSGIGIAILQPSSYALSLLGVLPYGSALLAAKRDSGTGVRWLSVIFNALWFSSMLLAAVMVYLERRGQSVMSGAVSSPNLMFTLLILGAIGIPCLLNTIYVAGMLRAKSNINGSDPIFR
jgi:hypothetical protein